jgi:hypothetical protein
MTTSEAQIKMMGAMELTGLTASSSAGQRR